MRRVAIMVWILAAATALVGVGCFVVVVRPHGLSDLGACAVGYWSVRVPIAPFWLSVLGCAALSLAAGLTRRRACVSALPVKEIEAIGESEATGSPALHRTLDELAFKLTTTLIKEGNVIAFVEHLMTGATRLGASDVHIQPTEDSSDIRLRLHGLLEPLCTVPGSHHRSIVNRIKVLADLISYVRDRPQDGHFTFRNDQARIDVRVSLLPTNHGEKAVLRLARAATAIPTLAGLDLSEGARLGLERALTRPQGLVFVTGPTGSGKTTTIYACLGYIKQNRGQTTNIATIEDPIEFDLPFLTQTQVNPEAGLDFAVGLKSILRQDPNVLLVGEIRDRETANIAIQAGLTGHTILTTVHAKAAAGVFNRLINMSIEPFLVASASLVSISQRLVRALCPECRRPAPPTSRERHQLEHMGVTLAGAVFTAGGCPSCGGQGFVGRIPLMEVLHVTPAIQDLVNAKVPTPRIHEAAIEEGMLPLLHDGIDRVRLGLTTVAEVLRATG